MMMRRRRMMMMDGMKMIHGIWDTSADTVA